MSHSTCSSSSSCPSPVQLLTEGDAQLIISSTGQLLNAGEAPLSPNTLATLAEVQAKRKKPNGHTSEAHSDNQMVKAVPDVFDRFVDVHDAQTKQQCQALMCKSCRLLIKKNVTLVSSHLCKKKDVERNISLPVSGSLLFRGKPKNRATPIWDEFEEVIEPTSGTLLGYARCKRCLEIIKTSDPKSIPAVLRRHLPLCPCGPFPPSLLITPIKSEVNGGQIVPPSTNGQIQAPSVVAAAAAAVRNAYVQQQQLLFQQQQQQQHLFEAPRSDQRYLAPARRDHLRVQNKAHGSALNMVPVHNQDSPDEENEELANGASTSRSLQLKTLFRERCIEFCCSELVSLETIASDSFRRLGQSLMNLGAGCLVNPKLPDTSQLYTQMHAHYSSLRYRIRSDLHQELQQNLGGALVCDSQDDLCILTTYYVNDHWQLVENVLSATTNGSDINAFITRSLNDYGLNEEDRLGKFTFVSRGGMFDGVNICLTSVAHTLDAIIEQCVFYEENLVDLVESCRLVLGELGIEVKPDESVESVEWILKFELMRIVIEHEDRFELADSSLNLNMVRLLVDLLLPFKNASVELRQCSHYPTINHVLLWYYKILKALKTEPPMVGKESDISLVRRMRVNIKRSLENQFQLHPLHKIAVFLWPNFRTLKMLTQNERLEVHKEVRALIDSRFNKDKKGEEKGANTSVEPTVKKARTEFSDWEEDADQLMAQDELDKYVNAILTPCNEASLLNWWRDHASEYPRLAQLARWVLSIPASVTSLEKYKLTSSQRVDEELLFLHCNLKLLQQKSLIETQE